MTQNIDNRIIFSFISGKGGVGKSIILSNLAKLFAKDFSPILIWDNDFFTPIQHLLAGVEPNIRLIDVLERKISIDKAICKISNEIYLLGGPTNLDWDIETDYTDILLPSFLQLLKVKNFNIIFFDFHSGVYKSLIDFARISSLNLLFITDDPTSVFDAYGLAKILFKIYGLTNIGIVVNNVVDKEDAYDIFDKFNSATKNFLKIEFPLLGFIPYNKDVKKQFFHHTNFLKNSNEDEFYNSLVNLKERILEHTLVKHKT
ncbi:MAG: P-loop NTPase [Ignavibacteria bacterium]|nr:P-loop NTPase [Ignavibacteria bacterium]